MSRTKTAGLFDVLKSKCAFMTSRERWNRQPLILEKQGNAMSLIDYQESQQISAANDWTFRALIMAAMRKADGYNLALLEKVFPDVLTELRARYNAPGGALSNYERDIIKRQLQQRQEEADDAEFDEEYD